MVLALISGCGRPPAPPPEVVVYVAHDQIYSEPILKAFEAETGTRAKVAYDTEASKTVGLVQRLIAEAAHPRADVFWNNEQAQTLVLAQKGLLAPYASPNAATIPGQFRDPGDLWCGFAARARVIIYNTNRVKEPPQSVFDLTQPQWKGKATIALPLLGTTATHAAALFALLGPDKAKQYLRDLRANGVIVASGNGHVRDLVAAGEAAVGLTDTDDANGGVLDGKPVKWLLPDQGEGQIGTLVIPNTVMMLRGGPNPESAKRLVDYLLRPDVEAELARSRALQMPLHPGVAVPPEVPSLDKIKAMAVDFAVVARHMDEAAAFVRDEFAR